LNSISDAWTRFQLRKFLAADPQPQDWKALCGTLVQVTRASYADFLAQEPKTAEDFVAFYRRQEESSRRSDPETGAKMRSLITHVQQVIGNADAYVDVSKDGSGIYAKGGNRGYFVWKKTTRDKDGKPVEEFGATAVPGFERYNGMKKRLLADTNVELLDTRLWKTDVVLFLPNETRSAEKGKSIVQKGFYKLGSISEGVKVELKPVAGGDVVPGRIAFLLKAGLRRHIFRD
jgi:hypothetical protein